MMSSNENRKAVGYQHYDLTPNFSKKFFNYRQQKHTGFKSFQNKKAYKSQAPRFFTPLNKAILA